MWRKKKLTRRDEKYIISWFNPGSYITNEEFLQNSFEKNWSFQFGNVGTMTITIVQMKSNI